MADQPQIDAAGDFTTAKAIIAMHQRYIDPHGTERCASASHGASRLGPRWPCMRSRLARRTIEAHDRAKGNEPAVTS